MIDFFSTIPDCLPLQIEVCRENIEWAINEKRIFLKQSLETRLVALYLDNKMYHQALDLISQLLKELKRLDDKMMLVEVQLLESRACHALRNIPKSRVRSARELFRVFLAWLYWTFENRPLSHQHVHQQTPSTAHHCYKLRLTCNLVYFTLKKRITRQHIHTFLRHLRDIPAKTTPRLCLL